MDTTSNQLTAPSWDWDVFLSFYGKDTRRKFTSHLYNALYQAGIKTFIDDHEIEKGEEISSRLVISIRSSKMFVVVLSKNYAYSGWCLNELVEILSCNRTKNQVVPVFYYVDPSDLRHQKGSFGVALESHKKRQSVHTTDKWRDALARIAELSGYHLKKDGNKDESDIVQEIVEKVAQQAFTKVLHLDEYLFGIDSAVEEIYQKLIMESNDVRAIGICGMGGIGKTTIAKSFYNKFWHKFDSSSFVENVKQSSQGGSPLLPLLEKLLTDLLGKKDYKVPNIVNGITQLKRILCFKKSLIVVDDLDQSSYSELLVSLCNSFSAGSRIIITTRDARLLNQLKQDISQVDIYTVKELGKMDSLELFSYHAFRKPMPPEHFIELSLSFVTYARGLPLALKVLGSSLRTHDVSFWKSKLKKVRNIPENTIQKILQLSYDELSDETQKTTFLDIVFFFVGMDKDEAVHILDSCGFFPGAEIPILVDRCLLIIDKDKKFQMHNLIQDMGREVIRKESEHGKCRRLHLCQENAIQTLKNLEGTNKIEVLILDVTRSTNKHFSASIFERLPNLSLLEIIDAHDIKDDFKNCFHELRCIRWSYCPWRRLPYSFRPQKLVSFDMQYNQFKTLWKDHMPPANLKTINMSYSRNLKTTYDFRDMKFLEKLSLRGCESLLEVHPSIGQLTSLCHLDLGECNHLKELPGPIRKLSKLGHLDLRGCVNLKRLPEPIKQLTNLGHLDLSDCSHLKQLPEQLGDMKGLRILDASSTAIEQLPDSIVHLKELVKLKVYKCEKLNKLPEQFGNMESLRILDASFSAIEQLPDSFERLINLVDLQLYLCKDLNSLPNNIWKLKFLQVLNLGGCSKLERLPEQLGKMEGLRRLDASGTAIEELPYSIGQLSKLETLHLYWCNKLKYVENSMGNLTSNVKLEFLSLRCNIRLCLPMILSFSSLRILNLTDEGHSFSSSEPFLSLSKLSNLEYLTLRNLGGSSFPELPLNLEELWVVHMYAELEQLPDLSSFKQLKRLYIERCSSLQSLPPLPPRLISLTVEECRSLQDVPDLSMLKELSTLRFTGCSSLKLISLKQSSLQVRGSYGFSAILPNREIPEWFNYKSSGCTVSFDIPPTFGQDNFLSFAFWVVYKCKNAVDTPFSYIRAVITNKTEGITINHQIYAPTPTDRIGETVSSVECIKGDDISVKSGDRIKLSFQKLLYSYDGGEYVPTGREVKVEMCGIHVIQRTPSTPYYIMMKDDQQSAITTTGLRNDHLHWVCILAIGLLTFFFIHLSFQTFM